MRVSYPDIKVPQWQGRRLRGFFGSGREADSLLHNHGSEGVQYRYPLVQYKVIQQVPTIVAIEEGIPAVYPLVMESETLRLGNQEYPCGTVRFDLRQDTVGDRPDFCEYRFLSPWFALNQTNYHLYQNSSADEKNSLLQKILIGNILSLAKGLHTTVEFPLHVDCQLRSGTVRFKNEMVTAFWGDFRVNYNLPDLFGIGKSISRGFGSIKRCNGL